MTDAKEKKKTCNHSVSSGGANFYHELLVPVLDDKSGHFFASEAPDQMIK